MRDFRQTQREALPSPVKGEVFRLQSSGNSPEIETLIHWDSPIGFWRGGLTISNRDQELRGVWRGELSLDRGSAAVLEFTVDTGWNVESVECSPANYVRDWTKIEQDAGHTIYRLTLAKPLDSRESLKLTWTANAQTTYGGSVLSGNRLDFVVPRDFVREYAYVGFQLGDEWDISFPGGEEPRRVDPREVPIFDSEISQNSPQIKMYSWQGAAKGWQVRCERKHVEPTAKIETCLLDRSEETRELYLIRLASTAIPARVLHTHFSIEHNESPRWTLQDDLGSRELSARRIPKSGHRNFGFAESGECWEVALPELKAGETTLRCERRIDGETSEVIPSLLTLSSSIKQRGLLRFFTDRDFRPLVIPGRLRGLQREPYVDHDLGVELAAWEYAGQETIELDDVTVPRMVRDDQRGATARPVLWRGVLESVCQAETDVRHVLNLYIENPGVRRWSFRLSPGMRLASLELNAEPLIRHVDPRDATRILIELDPTVRFAVLRIEWTAPAGSSVSRLRLTSNGRSSKKP
ncbi:MAG: hypothetical protein QM811_14320 [Pirellulales bacterium]